MKELTPDHRKNISDALKGRTFSPQHLENLSKAAREKGPPSAEARKNMSAAGKGRPKTEEHRRRISEALKKARPRSDPGDYFSMHASMGRAANHPCFRCGGAALDWAYQHDAEEELVGPEGWPYSLNSEDYKPMCRSCHKKLDWQAGNTTRTWKGYEDEE